tara:strand:+ start:2924 stop:3991 length:1068 start_codon:yes stop_codon:yes gene_type:complete
MLEKIKLGKRKISNSYPPLVIAEISANHNNSLKNTLKMIEDAAKIGVEAIKVQTFDLDEMTLNLNHKEFLIKKQFKNKKWNKRSLYNLYSEAQLPFEWHKKIFEKAKSLGLICFSSVFDLKSLKLLEKLNVPAYKIASLESLHFPLIAEVCKTKKPLIISTGTLNEKEIDKLIKFLRRKKFKNFAILHCVTEYPAKFKNINLRFIKKIKKKYNCVTGFSDHTKGVGAAISSVAFGALIIEKHFKGDSKKYSLDDEFSLDNKNMKILVNEVKNSWDSIGKNKLNLSKAEKIYKRYRRSIYVSKEIRKGEVFTKNNLRVIRPGLGLEPEYFEKVLGKISKRNLKKGDALKKDFVKFY